MIFQEKCFSFYILLTGWYIHCPIALLLLEVLVHMCIAIVCFSRCDVMNFKINLIFPIKSFFLHDQKMKTKILISWKPKVILRWNKKHFSSILNKFYCQKLSQTWECAFITGPQIQGTVPSTETKQLCRSIPFSATASAYLCKYDGC